MIEKNNIFLPLTLEWRITDACNLRCWYCNDYKPAQALFSLEKSIERIKRLSPKHIWLGGGEPTLAEELPHAASKLKEKINCHLGLSTNLTKPNIIIKMLPFLDDLIISLDTMNRKESLKIRGVEPEQIIYYIKKLHDIAFKKRLGINITINSVIYEQNIKNQGIEKLNRALRTINRNITHMFCPILPSSHPGSIIKKEEYRKKFNIIVEKLKKNGARIQINFPQFSKLKFRKNVKCYRRHFRIQMVKDGSIFSPCPPASPLKPMCAQPCDSGLFINDLLYAKATDDIKHSPLKGLFTEEEINRLIDFIQKYINFQVKKDIFSPLLLKK